MKARHRPVHHVVATIRAAAAAVIGAVDPSEARAEQRAYRDIVRRSVLPARTTEVAVTRDVRVAMTDGAVLLTDIWTPTIVTPDRPVVLIRTPYGRSGMGSVARAVAERGVPVVVQSCRGTFGSGGTFEPFAAEDRDGAETVAWIEQQPWFTGTIATAGASYVGHTQWAIAAAAPPSVRLQVISVSARSFRSVFRPGDGFALETMLAWVMAIDRQERSRPSTAWWLLTAARQRIARGAMTVPMSGAAKVATGHDVGYFNRWVEGRGAGDRWWAAADPGIDLASLPRLVLVAGWHDLFLVGQLDDHRDLVAAGHDVRLVIGAWTHMDPELGARSLRELLDALGGGSEVERAASVEVEVMPDLGWRTLPMWPPPAELCELHLGIDGSLSSALGPAGTRSFRYDPADPTPMTGGRGLNPFSAGSKEQSEREQRDDVVVFTGPVLERDLTVIGDVTFRSLISSDARSPDIFVRLCDVDASGVSMAVTDGYVRLADGPPDVPRDVSLTLAATAYCWRQGHRLRLQVSSGAHPLYARNPGTSDPINDFSDLVPSTQQVHFGAPNRTVLMLPVVDGSLDD